MPNISIIIPMYNAQNTILETIKSICSQTYSDWELLIVNDGSTDSSSKIVEENIKLDKRIRLFNQDNQGRSSARNAGIKLAKGKWLCFVDADDLLPIMALEILSNAIEENSHMILCGYSPSSAANHCSHKINSIRGADLAALILNPNNSLPQDLNYHFFDGLFERTVWGKLYLADTITSNNISFYDGLVFGEDAIFNIQASLLSPYITIVDSVTYTYNRNDEGTVRRYRSDDKEKLIDFSQAALVTLSQYVDSGTIKKNDLFYFIYDEFMRFFRRAASFSTNIDLTAKDINDVLAHPLILRAESGYMQTRTLSKIRISIYQYLFKHNRTDIALWLEKHIMNYYRNKYVRNLSN